MKENKLMNRDLSICFPHGILGFEDIKDYRLCSKGEGPVWELCPQEGEYPQFVVFEAESVADQYAPKLPGSIISLLKAENPAELSFFVIAVVPGDISKTTVNLKSPVVVNVRTGLAAQVVLEGTGYPMRHPIFGAKGGTEACL